MEKVQSLDFDIIVIGGGSAGFAAGDVLATPGLVYVAAKEGQTAAANSFANVPVPLSYDNVPEVIFTHPPG